MDGVFFYFYNSVIIYCCKCGASSCIGNNL